jgi:hypothetical protein
MHGNFPTNSFKGSIHLTTYTICHRCGSVLEDDIHTLRDCYGAVTIWRFICSDRPSDKYCAKNVGLG